jgi:precorrin-6A/cobalt-precorrin-6A reductase
MLLWMIGGTQESAQLAIALLEAQIPCIITVTTAAARSLYPNAAMLKVWVGRLTPATLPTFLQTHEIDRILDVSHPFAVEVSQMAIAAAQQFALPYLRYERPQVAPLQLEAEPVAEDGLIYSFERLDDLLESTLLRGERVLLTLGYRFLEQFRCWQEQTTLFARILPSAVALEAAFAAGFSSDRLIALRPPISLELEKALWQQWQISMVVTKASGVAGGEDVKRQLAAELGIKLVLIERPAIDYPQQTNQIEVALAFCKRRQK